MPVRPNSIIPGLLEQILNKYEQEFKEQYEKGAYTKDSAKKLIIDLDVIFGDVLKVALRILDEQIITIYKTDKDLLAIVEITESRRSQRVVKLLPDINYCQCEFFASHVLQVEKPETSTDTADAIKDHEQYYTCQHILALRLAKLLRAESCMRTEILPAQQFNYLLRALNTNDSSLSNDLANKTSMLK